MEYNYLKLGTGNEEAELRLNKSRPDAAVFFDDCSERDYENGKGKSQPRLFWERGKKQNREETVMVVIHRGRIWFLQPAGKVQFSAPYDHSSGVRLTTKAMPVKILKSGWCKDVPPVLAGIGSSQYH